MKPEGTYLVWLDFSAYNLTHLEIQEKLRYDAKLILNDGLTFGKEGKNMLESMSQLLGLLLRRQFCD